MRIIISVSFLIITTLIWSQRPIDYAIFSELYKEHDYVLLEDNTTINISHHKEKGVEIIRTLEKTFYLTSDRAGLFQNDKIYSSYFEKILNKEAFSLNVVTGKDRCKKEKVKDFETDETISNDVFFDDVVVTSFQYKGVKKGSILSLKYTSELTDPHLSFSAFFSSSHPVVNKTMEINVEDGIEISTVYFNMDSTDVNFTTSRKRNSTTYRWEKDTLEIYKPEPSSPKPRYFVPHFVSRISHYVNQDGEKIGVLEGVQDLYNWYSSMVNEVKCEDTLSLHSLVHQIVSPEDSEREKVRKVFQWVQNNVRYIAIEDGLGGFIPRDPDVVLKRRYGDCKDMATLIYKLLKIQDIPSYLVWIGTRDLPYRYEELPSPVIDNHMITAYYDEIAGEYIFLDATDDNIAFGYPSGFIQGKEALIDKENGNFEIVSVPIPTADKTIMADSVQLYIEDYELRGKGEMQLTGYYAADTKDVLKASSREKSKKKFTQGLTQKGNNKYDLEKYNIALNENEVIFDYEFSIPSYINKTENEIYINLNLENLSGFFSAYEVKDRKRAVTERYATQTQYVYNLTIPEGYELDYVPEDVSMDGGDLFSFHINYDASHENQVVYNFNLILNYIHLDVEDVPSIVELGKKVKTAYKETIILKKIR